MIRLIVIRTRGSPTSRASASSPSGCGPDDLCLGLQLRLGRRPTGVWVTGLIAHLAPHFERSSGRPRIDPEPAAELNRAFMDHLTVAALHWLG